MSDNKYSGSKAAGENVASLTCELEGILFGLDLAVRYFESSKYRKNTENLYILYDCLSAINVSMNKLYSPLLHVLNCSPDLYILKVYCQT